MGEANVDPAFLGVESNTFDPPGPLQGQESGEEIDVAHGRVTVRLAMGREYHGAWRIFSWGNPADGRGRGSCDAGSGPRVRLPESLSWSSVGSDPAVNCRVAVLRSKLEEPGRRIGQRGDATRAPTQGPRPGWAAGRRPSASRDLPQSDKSIYSFCRRRHAWRARSFSSFPLNRHTIPYACSSMITKREFLPTVKPEEPLF